MKTRHEILQIVAATFEVSPDAIASPSKKRVFSIPRWVYWKMLWNAKRSLKQCAEATGHTDHTSVMHALNTLPAYIVRDDELRRKVAQVEELLEVAA